MKILLMMFTVLSLNSFAQESVKDQVINMRIQENISAKIKSLKEVNFIETSLSEYVMSEEEKCLQNAKNDADLEVVCFENTKRMNSIGDLETVIDLDIARLTDYQSSIVFTMFTVYFMIEDSPLWGLLIPVAIVADVIASPYWIYILIIN